MTAHPHISPFWRRFAVATAILSVVAAFSAGVAYNRAVDAAKDARVAARTAKQTALRAEASIDDLCRRSRRFQPLIAKDLGARRVLAGRDLRDYIATIPKSCPSDHLRGKTKVKP